MTLSDQTGNIRLLPVWSFLSITYFDQSRMKKFLPYCLSLLMACSLVSCHKDKLPEDEYEVPNRTLFVYMPWTGSTSSAGGALTDFFNQNIASMKEAVDKQKGTNKTDIIVYKANSQSQSVIFRIRYNTTKQACEFDTLNADAGFHSVSKENLLRLLNQINAYSHTASYALLAGCHGSGWTPRGSDSTMPRAASRAFGGIGQEMQYDVSDLSYAIAHSAIKKMTYICFDDCYMANVETAYELKDVADWFVASTSEVMGDGMPYGSIFQYMLGEPDYEKWVEGFYNHYQSSDMPYGALSAIRCGTYIEKMAQAMKAINRSCQFDVAKLDDVQFLDGYDNHVFFDLASYVDQLGVQQPLLSNFQTALRDLVVHKKTTTYIYTTYYNTNRKGDNVYPRNTFKVNTFSGITISDPTRNSTVYTQKDNTAWWKATH